MNKSLLCALLLTVPDVLLAQATPSWPAKLFAPYAYIPYNDAASACLAETGQKFFTLAFVVSDPRGRPAWDGQTDRRVKKGFYADAIGAIRARGGDVIVSFGGEGGKELALTTPDAAGLAAKYQEVVDRYHLTWLDFDIEGKTLANQPVNQRRNAALQTLRAARPGLRYTFTLPGDPTGLEDDALQLLADARAQGVAIESVNVMTMDYKREVSKGAKMGDLVIQAARAVHGQLSNLGLDVKIGVTPMIGENDVKSVVFSPADAAGLLAFAQQTPWVRSVSIWSVNRDGPGTSGDDTNSGTAQTKWEFTNAFKALSE